MFSISSLITKVLWELSGGKKSLLETEPSRCAFKCGSDFVTKSLKTLSLILSRLLQKEKRERKTLKNFSSKKIERKLFTKKKSGGIFYPFKLFDEPKRINSSN